MPLELGSPLFIVGPNGSGKSALIQHAVSSLGSANVRRISAHRQTWFESSSIDLTPQSRRQFEQNLIGQEPSPEYRYREWNPNFKLASALFDLYAKQSSLARRIMDEAYAKNHAAIDEITECELPIFDQINNLLSLGGFSVTVENKEDEEILARHRDIAEPYGIDRMFDGERSAVILAANVLTVSPGTILLIDEPERHLHRSIIEPFLTALFEQRKDCPFVISTHEPALPMSNPNSDVLVVRSCQWNGTTATAWDVSLLEKDTGLPEDVKRAILGARRMRREYQSNLPNWRSISENAKHLVCIDTEKPYAEELCRFRSLREAEDIEKIIARYPVRESAVIDKIVGAFDLSREKYEKTLLSRVRTDTGLAEKIRRRIGPLSLILK